MNLFALKEYLHVVHGLNQTQALNFQVLSLLYIFTLPKWKTPGRKSLLLLPVVNFLRGWTDVQVWDPLR